MNIFWGGFLPINNSETEPQKNVKNQNTILNLTAVIEILPVTPYWSNAQMFCQPNIITQHKEYFLFLK